jgi:large subunit ribosomal protein L28
MKDTGYGRIPLRAGGWCDSVGASYSLRFERIYTMAKCENCGKTTTFGHNRSFSQRATNRKFRPNLQRVTVMAEGRRVRKVLCAKCIRTMVKTS